MKWFKYDWWDWWETRSSLERTWTSEGVSSQNATVRENNGAFRCRLSVRNLHVYDQEIDHKRLRDGDFQQLSCWAIKKWREEVWLTPCCPPRSIFSVLLSYNSPVSDILSNSFPPFLFPPCEVCDFYPKRHFEPHWRHISRHECAGNCCNRRENNSRRTKKRLWNGR